MSLRAPLALYPGMNRFVRDWISGDERFLRRHSEAPSSPRKSPPDASLAAALVESNRGWGIDAKPSLDRWMAGETLTIVAGQQVGFAGGPLYTIAKIATLIRLKRDLESQGIGVTAFFWLATEDHDFDEVASLNLPVATIGKEKDVNRQRDLHCIRATGKVSERPVVGSLPVPETLTTALLELYDHPRPRWLREGITFRDSFAELIATVCGDELILVDALQPELRRAGGPLFDQIRRRSAEIQQALAARATELERAGYREQVIPRDGDEYTLLFEVGAEGIRRPSMEALPPEQTSTSALTRPLLQDQVLGTDVFVGGPAEVAYYAQLSPLHDLLGIGIPRVALRGHVLVASGRAVGAMARYGIEPAEVFASPDAIAAAREPEAVASIRTIAEEAKGDLLRRIEDIRKIALPADHSLAGSIERSIGHIDYHFGKLAERAVRSVARRDRNRHDFLRRLTATLHPDGHVQDRVAGWFPWWCRYGEHFMQRLIEEVEPDSDSFRIAGI
jgi:bacillithiol synthase